MAKATPPAPWSVPEPFSFTRRPNSEKTNISTLLSASCSRRSSQKSPIADDTSFQSLGWFPTCEACVSKAAVLGVENA